MDVEEGGRLSHAGVAALVGLSIVLATAGFASALGVAARSPPIALEPRLGSAYVPRGVVIDIGLPGSADSVYARYPAVVRETNGSFKMWYSGFDGFRNRILYATSTNGLNWTKHGVVIDVVRPPWYFDSLAAESVLKIGATYHMWFGGGFWSRTPTGWTQIYHATSLDGQTWTVSGVALPPGPSGSWDAVSAHTPVVVQDPGGLTRMYYQGWDGTTYGIGLAFSTDFSNFTRYAGNPVLSEGTGSSFDSGLVASTAVVRGTDWTMYYSGWNGSTTSIGVATSVDGAAWTKSPTNPWLSANPSSSWESRSVDNADYVHTPADERIYYTGYDGVNGRIGLLTAATPGPGSAGGIEPILLELIVLVAVAAVGGGVVIFVLFRMDSRGRPR